jgi:hypothetical protein
MTGGKPIAVLLQSISGVSAINPLVVFYDIYGERKVAPNHHTIELNKVAFRYLSLCMLRYLKLFACICVTAWIACVLFSKIKKSVTDNLFSALLRVCVPL